LPCLFAGQVCGKQRNRNGRYAPALIDGSLLDDVFMDTMSTTSSLLTQLCHWILVRQSDGKATSLGIVLQLELFSFLCPLLEYMIQIFFSTHRFMISEEHCRSDLLAAAFEDTAITETENPSGG